jgi:hypothetical protein
MAGGKKKYEREENIKMKKIDTAMFFCCVFLLAIGSVSTTLNLNIILIIKTVLYQSRTVFNLGCQKLEFIKVKT